MNFVAEWVSKSQRKFTTHASTCGELFVSIILQLCLLPPNKFKVKKSQLNLKLESNSWKLRVQCEKNGHKKLADDHWTFQLLINLFDFSPLLCNTDTNFWANYQIHLFSVTRRYRRASAKSRISTRIWRARVISKWHADSCTRFTCT